ncbi:undecaprenyl-diphosphate phosphatase [Phormidium yuhuli AB48]|uniref:Undecaprenyl-diphosphatase n=2 Tax=Phormidium TaxID=1198 RepID=A0ABY5AJU1_9CYAN|nr:undecaprenyl-diphosphate phosphatase [Phormidium yuhuli]USR89457.1 undecaprenyl-diphosphate phosphatase [Phormidium yuhuli AB48]
MARLQYVLFVGVTSLSWAIAIPMSQPGIASSSPIDLVTWQPNVLEAIILGMVQGLTEFIPISSSAHLKVIPEFLGWGDPGASFTAVIQLGSIVAVIWYFWKDLIQVFGGGLRAILSRDYQNENFKIALGIILGTIPISVVGLIVKLGFREFYEFTARSLVVIAIVSIVMGLLLGLTEQFCRHKRTFSQLQTRDGILMGLAQTLALIPGVSRSGSTITAGLFMGLERATAARFSFLLGLPAITLAGIVELGDVLEATETVGPIPLIAGILSAGVFSYLSIAWLINYLKTQSTWLFVWYRVAFGIVILGGLASGLLQS